MTKKQAPGGNVLVRIRSLMPELAPAERRLAELALADPPGVAARTISEVAQAGRTSETTVVRFSRAVGFSGYPDLRLALAAAGAHEEASGANSVVGSDISAKDSLPDVIAKIGYADSGAVEDTIAQLDVAVLERVVDKVVKARRVDLYGVGASAFVALDLQQKLHRIGLVTFAWPDPHAALTSAALLGPDDVAIGMSHTGSTRDTVDALALAKRNRATTVAVTNFPRSPISQVADLVLTTAARETTFRSGAMASRIAALTVVDCLFVAVAQRNYSSTRRALERTYKAVSPRRREG